MKKLKAEKKKSIKEIWDSMSPEERICHPMLRYLSEELLLKGWDEMPESSQRHIIILLC